MSRLRFGVCGAIIFAAASFVSTSAQAVAVSCPGTAATTDREFTLTTSVASTCLASGVGNINGAGDAITALGYVLLDKSDDALAYLGTLNELVATTGSLIAGLSGSLSFTAPAGYNNFVLGFKSGQGVLDPDWAAFLLPAGVTSGSWTISGSQALSHVNLYAKACTAGAGCGPGEEIGEVPVPGAVFLMGSVLAGGVGGMQLMRRRRKFAA